MAIRRACSYTATFTTPEDPTNYSAMLLTISQNGSNLINKSMNDLTIADGVVTLQLTQSETASLTAGKNALIQLRCFASAYNAPGSAVFAVEVTPALNDTILS